MLTISLVCSGFGQTPVPRDALRPGIEVEIELLETISSETLHAGETVPFKLLRGLECDGVTLLPAGTPFVGTVTRANAKGHWGKAGSFDLKLEPLKLPDGTLVRLDFHRVAKRSERDEKTAETIDTAIQMAGHFPIIPVALIAASRKGRPFTIRAGERYLVYTTGTEAATTEPKGR